MYVKITFNPPRLRYKWGLDCPRQEGSKAVTSFICRPTLGEEKGEFTLLGKVTKHLEFFIVHLYIGLD